MSFSLSPRNRQGELPLHNYRTPLEIQTPKGSTRAGIYYTNSLQKDAFFLSFLSLSWAGRAGDDPLPKVSDVHPGRGGRKDRHGGSCYGPGGAL